MASLDLALERLRSQRITRPLRGTPADVAGWLVAVQAQDFAGAKWALGVRLRGATEADVERAFDKGTILRTHLLRPTWHFVTPADIRWMLALTGPRVLTRTAYRHRQLGLERSDFVRSSDALVRSLEGGRHRTRDQLRQALREAGVETAGQRMAYLLMRAELDGLLCSGPRREKQFTYALLEERAPESRILSREEGLAELARRYFPSRGPATVHDFAKWSGLTVADARAGLEAVADGLGSECRDGRRYWLATTRGRRSAGSRVAHLLSIFDEYLSSYRDHSAMVESRHAARFARKGNALAYIVVIDGRIVGTWRRRLGKTTVEIETDLFVRPSRSQRQAIQAAAERYARFVGRSVELVQR